MLSVLHFVMTKVKPPPKETPKYKLFYFNVRAKGEIIRWIFAVAGVEYEDIRLDDAAWAEFKPKTPFGQIPVLEIDGEMWCQSWTIARMLAKRFGLAGKTEYEEHRCNMIVDCVNDMVTAQLKLKFAPDKEKDEIEKKWKEEQEPNYCRMLEKLLISNNGGNGYFVGNEMTWADLAVCVWMGWVRELDYTPYPKLAAHRERVTSHPRLAEWLAKRPETSM